MDTLVAEFERLEALRSLAVLDTPPEAQYDNVTSLAAEIFDVPIALVSLVDEGRQWFKSNCGLIDATETPRDIAFCHHAIQGSDVMVVEDALKDDRFKENPLVLGEPNIRFYAGAPLITKEGFALGTLCIIDQEPRTFEEDERLKLSRMASLIIGAIEKHALTLEVYKLAEAAKKESELSRSICDASEAGILRLEAIRNAEGKLEDFLILAASKATLTVAGIVPEDVIGQKFLGVFPHAKNTELFQLNVDVVEKGTSYTHELPYYSDGIKGWFRVKGEPCGVDGLTTSTTLITDRKKFEETVIKLKSYSLNSVEDLDEYLSHMLHLGLETFDASDGFVSKIEGDKYILRGHEGGISGLEAGLELDLADTICSVIVEQQKPFAIGDIQGADKERHPALQGHEFGSYLGFPIFVNGKFDGTISFVSSSRQGQAYLHSDMEILSLIASNIGHALELESAFAKMRSLNEELRLVLDNVPAWIWYKDDKNKILRANKAALESVGLKDPSDVEGVQTEALFPDLAAKYFLDDQAVLSSGVPRRNIIEPYAPSNGQQGWITTDKIPMTTEDGRQTILAVATDITELKLKEEQLSRLNEGLADFAFVASHDLQAPLRQSAMFAELFSDELERFGLELPGESGEYLAEVLDGLTRMRMMVRSLYDLFKLDSENIAIENLDLGLAVNQAIKQTQPLLDGISGDLELGSFFKHKANEELIVQVIQNLITNAIKYSSVSELKIKIYSEIDVLKRVKKIIFEDNGVGIPREFEKKIFEPFKRLHHSSQVEGAGIGLALCKKIMRLHDGDLYLDPDYHEGARFVLSFTY